MVFELNVNIFVWINGSKKPNFTTKMGKSKIHTILFSCEFIAAYRHKMLAKLSMAQFSS